MPQLERELIIVNKLGLHARAAAKFVTLAGGYESEVRLWRDGREVNAKSIMGVMMLAAARGTVLRLTVAGPDAEEAAAALAELVENRFGEDE